MKTHDENSQRLIKILNAPPEQQEAIDRILDGKQEPSTPQAAGPLLMGMSDAAKLLGVSRATLWRMLQADTFQKVEILPGSYRLRRIDLENFVNGKVA